MAVQSRNDVTSRSPDLGRNVMRINGLTVEQDAGRSGDIEAYTVMAWNAAHTKLVPLTDNTAVDGSQIPVGLIAHSIPEANIIAGDVTECEMIEMAEGFNQGLIVLENSLELDDTFQFCNAVATITTADASDLATAITLVNAIKTALNASIIIRTIREQLIINGIIIRRNEYASRVENS